MTNGTSYALSARITDVAGNQGAASTALNVTVDTVAPSAPAITVSDDVGSVTGPLANNARTDDTNLTVTVSLTGTGAVAGDTVQLLNGTTALGSAYTLTAADISLGTVALQTGALTNGTSYALSARITDVAGNQSAAATALNVTVDTTAPSAPGITVSDDVGSVTGTLANNARTDDTDLTVTVTLTGTGAAAGDVVQLLNGSSTLGSAYTLTAADITRGTVALQTGALTNGTSYALSARITDVAGNQGAAATALNVTVDTSAPTAPTIAVADDVGSIKGTLANNARTDDTDLTVTVTLTGTGAAAGDVVQLLNGSSTLGSAYTLTAADITRGTVALQTGALTNGTSYALSARITDVAGNQGAASTALNVTVDTVAPSAPAITVSDDVGSVTGPLANNARTDDTNLTVTVSLTGTGAVAGDTVQLLNGTTALGSAYTLTAADISLGTVALQTGALTNGTSYALSARITDVAGNQGTTSTALNVTVDTTAAKAPTITVTDNVGSIKGTLVDNARTDDTDLTVTVSLANTGAVAGDVLRLLNGTSALGSPYTLTAADILQGSVALQTGSLANGTSYALSARIDNAAGTPGATATTLNVTIDTVAPSKPALALAQDTGISDSDGVTKNPTINVTGLESSSTWQYSTDGGQTWSTAQSASTTSFNLPSEGTYAIGAVRVRQTDTAGNVSDVASNAQAITLDRTPPASATVSLVTDSGTDGDWITYDGRVRTFIENGGYIEYSLDGGTNWTRVSGENIAYFDIPEGTYAAGQVKVNWYDKAGNSSGVSTINKAIVIDKTPPATPTFALAEDSGLSDSDGVTKNPKVNVSGLESGSTWQYSTDGGQTWSSPQASTTTSFNLADGTYDIGKVKVLQTDLAGNNRVSSANTQAITVDTSRPSSATVTLKTDSGIANNDGISNVGTFETYLELGGYLKYSLDGGTSWTTLVSNGTDTKVTFDVPEGRYSSGKIQIEWFDKAGNSSGVSTLNRAFVIDKTTPDPVFFFMAADTGASSKDGVTKNPRFNVNIGLEDGATWEYSSDGGKTWKSPVSASDNSFELPDGDYAIEQIRVRQTDRAGNVSNYSYNGYAITIDTTNPTDGALSLVSDTGSSGSDLVTSDGRLTTRVEIGGYLEYTVDGGTNWTRVVNNGTTDSLGIELPEGTYSTSQFQFRTFDKAGNTSGERSLSGALVVDKTAPLTPGFTLRSDTGSSQSDKISQTGDIDVQGLESGATWEYSTNGGTSWTRGSGSSFTLSEGSYAAEKVRVRQIDAAGNVSGEAKNTSTIVIDQTAPQGAVTGYIDDVGNQQGAFGFNTPTNDTRPTFTGTGEDGATVKLYAVYKGNSIPLGTTTIANGVWSMPFSGVFPEGSFPIYAIVTDTAGNSTQTPNVTFTVDTSTSGTLDGYIDNTVSSTTVVDFATQASSAQLSYTGTAEAGATVDLYTRVGTTDTKIGTATADAKGKWTLRPTNDLAENTYKIFARVTDQAGNSFDTPPRDLTISLPRAPSAPPIVPIIETLKPASPSIDTGDTSKAKINLVQASFGAPIASVFDVKPVQSVVVTSDGRAAPTDVTGSTQQGGANRSQVPVVEYSSYLRPAFVEIGVLVRDSRGAFVAARNDALQITSVRVSSRSEYAPWIEDTRTGRILVRRDGPDEIRMQVEITLQDGTVIRQDIRVDSRSGQFEVLPAGNTSIIPQSLDQQLANVLWGDMREVMDFFEDAPG